MSPGPSRQLGKNDEVSPPVRDKTPQGDDDEKGPETEHHRYGNQNEVKQDDKSCPSHHGFSTLTITVWIKRFGPFAFFSKLFEEG